MTTVPRGLDTLLTEGLIVLLADAGLCSWSPNGVYTTGQQSAGACAFVDVMPATPDKAITLTVYGSDDDPTLSDTTALVQVRTRWSGKDPRPARDLLDAVNDRLQNLPQTTLSTGVTVTGAWRRSRTPLGPDSAGRHEHTANYAIRAHHPTTHRT